jgi:serine phosphatase RsbU (regulator of sigma subunit)
MANAPAPSTASSSVWLVPLSGPKLAALELPPKQGGVVIGRHEQCDVHLPADADKVSRYHVRFTYEQKQWRLADLNSRCGTFLNGVKVQGGQEVPINEGDLIRITPWTFSFSAHPRPPKGEDSFDDVQSMRTMVRSITPESARPLADDMLTLLLESAAGIHGAQDEKALAELILDVAVRGTGLANAALLRPLDNAGRIEVIASKFSPLMGGSNKPSFSRSLIAAASAGVVAELSGSDSDNISQSIVQMQINAAICVPLMLGADKETVAAFLYLDSRGNLPSGRALPGGVGGGLRKNASAFCLGLGRMAGLALANLKRLDVEKRQAMLEAELSAGAEAQRWILPRRESRHGKFFSIGESRPGRYVGGDFFDVVPLGDNRLAVALGDVSGKGIPASVLMTASEGFLHAQLNEHADVGRAVTSLNKFINPRRPEQKFITMWVGVFDLNERTLTYVDAGHGYAVMIAPDGTFQPLMSGDGMPVGIMDDAEYKAETVSLEPGARALVVSDGIVEQFGTVTDDQGNPVQKQFEMDGVQDALRSITSGGDEVAGLFKMLIAYAGTEHLADDATAVLVRW